METYFKKSNFVKKLLRWYLTNLKISKCANKPNIIASYHTFSRPLHFITAMFWYVTYTVIYQQYRRSLSLRSLDGNVFDLHLIFNKNWLWATIWRKQNFKKKNHLQNFILLVYFLYWLDNYGKTLSLKWVDKDFWADSMTALISDVIYVWSPLSEAQEVTDFGLSGENGWETVRLNQD